MANPLYFVVRVDKNGNVLEMNQGSINDVNLVGPEQSLDEKRLVIPWVDCCGRVCDHADGPDDGPCDCCKEGAKHRVSIYRVVNGAFTERLESDINLDIANKKRKDVIDQLIDTKKRLSAVDSLLLDLPGEANLLKDKASLETLISELKAKL